MANSRLPTMIAEHEMMARNVPGIRCKIKAPMPAKMQPPTAIGTYHATTCIGLAPIIFVMLLIEVSQLYLLGSLIPTYYKVAYSRKIPRVP